MSWRRLTISGAKGLARPLLHSLTYPISMQRNLHRGVQVPIIKLIIIPCVSEIYPSASHEIRKYHVNPYTGEEEKEADKEHQRKLNQHGLKSDSADYSTTIMQRARERLNASAAQRKERVRNRNRRGSNK
ncbi:hypothetical protein HJC23_003013 [Cyclotella cryptica]|uniref:Uncharacterized protein n=1 Tax=Cyclotella cryptica TaxID=29204 RepID=A0ABD3PTU6_9STRA